LWRNILKEFNTCICLLLLGCVLTFDVFAEEKIGPILPPAKGEQCVEPTDIMREIHYEFILHHRDATVHDGIRTTKHSLKNCINCHVQKDKNGVYPRADSAEHFCGACHLFTSVEIDCFSCHADRPEEAYTSNEHTNPSN